MSPIWFEIWRSCIRVKHFEFSRQISEKFRFFSGNFTQKIRLSSQISEKFQFFRQFKLPRIYAPVMVYVMVYVVVL